MKKFILKALLGKDFKAVKNALEFSTYTHYRRGEATLGAESEALNERLGLGKPEISYNK